MTEAKAMTTGRIRCLLMNNKVIRSNIFQQRQTLVRPETEAEIIEAKAIPAFDYAKDIVQTTCEPKSIEMSSVRKERYDQRSAIRARELYIDGQERELEHLDFAVLHLPAVEQFIVISRYYNQESSTVTAKRLQELKDMQSPYTIRHINRLREKAIQMIADIFNQYAAESQDVPENIVGAGEYGGRMEEVFDIVMSVNV